MYRFSFQYDTQQQAILRRLENNPLKLQTRQLLVSIGHLAVSMYITVLGIGWN